MSTTAVDSTAIQLRLEALRGNWTPQEYTDKVQIEEQRVLVVSDVHVPFHDEALLADVFERAYMQDYEAIVWLGDLMDMPTQSSYGNDDPTTYMQRELDITEGILTTAAGIFKRQYWGAGNHEQRLFRKVGKQAGMRELARMAGVDRLMRSGHLVVSDDPTFHYRDNWMLTHPETYGNTPLVVPGKIADRYQMNVVSAHAHHWGQGTSPSGRFQVIESGGAFHPGRIAYVNRGVTTHRAWVQGYVSLNYGTAQLHR